MKKTILILMLVVFAAGILPAVSEASLTINIPGYSFYQFTHPEHWFGGYFDFATPPGQIHDSDIVHVEYQVYNNYFADLVVWTANNASYAFETNNSTAGPPLWGYHPPLWGNDPTLVIVNWDGMMELIEPYGSEGMHVISGQLTALVNNNGYNTIAEGYPFVLEIGLNSDDDGGGEAPEPATIAGLLFAAAGVAVRRLRRK